MNGSIGFHGNLLMFLICGLLAAWHFMLGGSPLGVFVGMVAAAKGVRDALNAGSIGQRIADAVWGRP